MGFGVYSEVVLPVDIEVLPRYRAGRAERLHGGKHVLVRGFVPGVGVDERRDAVPLRVDG